MYNQALSTALSLCLCSCVCVWSFKGLSFSFSANLIVNLACGRGNVGAELSSGATSKPMVMNRDATPTNTLDQWLYTKRLREREWG